MEKDINRNLLIEECISRILSGENVKEVLKKYKDISATDLLNYKTNTQKTTTLLAENIANYITIENPNLDDYLVLFSDERKDPLDAILLGLNEVAKPYRKNPESETMQKLDSEMKTIRKYKEPYKATNKYGFIDPQTNEMKYASNEQIDKTLEFISSNYDFSIKKLGFVPDYLVSQYITGYLKDEHLENTQTLGDFKPQTDRYSREDLIRRIQEKQERKANKLKEIADLDKYMRYMKGEIDKADKGREE